MIFFSLKIMKEKNVCNHSFSLVEIKIVREFEATNKKKLLS
jgi:hypothetical protein